MELKVLICTAALALLLAACSSSDGADAYGQFEADMVTVSAQANGQLLSFSVKEGMKLEEGTQVGHIDSTQLVLKIKELNAGIRSIASTIPKLQAQSAVYEEQLKTARKELDRFLALQKDNAATQQQIDQAQGQVNTLEKQIASLAVQVRSVQAEMEVARARVEQVQDQLKHTLVKNPMDGTVVTVYMDPFEMVSVGRPLYDLANLEEMELRVFISGAQLPEVALGNEVRVRIDEGADSLRSLHGRVSWIASEAEFTPRMIQTKEERVTQVYAVKVRVPNPDGALKIGMPGEVIFQ